MTYSGWRGLKSGDVSVVISGTAIHPCPGHRCLSNMEHGAGPSTPLALSRDHGHSLTGRIWVCCPLRPPPPVLSRSSSRLPAQGRGSPPNGAFRSSTQSLHLQKGIFWGRSCCLLETAG